MRAWGDEMFSRLSCPRAPSHRRSKKPSPDSGTEGRDQLTRSLSGPSTCQLSSHGCSKGSVARGQEKSEPINGCSGLNRSIIPSGQDWDKLHWKGRGLWRWIKTYSEWAWQETLREQEGIYLGFSPGQSVVMRVEGPQSPSPPSPGRLNCTRTLYPVFGFRFINVTFSLGSTVGEMCHTHAWSQACPEATIPP